MMKSLLTFCNSWIVAFSCCAINFLLDGLTRISGILFVSVQEVFGVNRRDAAFPFALCVAIRNLSGPCVGIVAGKYGPGSVTLVGGLVAAASVGLSCLSKNLTHLIMIWGVLFGVGYGMGDILLNVLIANTYSDRLARASGIAYSGSCIGSVVLPPLLQHLLFVYGLNGTFLIMSGIVLHCVPLSLLILINLPSRTRESLNPRRYLCSKPQPKLLGVEVARDVKLPTPSKIAKHSLTPGPSSEETDSGKGSSDWRDALEDKYSFLSAVSSNLSYRSLSLTAIEKTLSVLPRNATENVSNGSIRPQAMESSVGMGHEARLSTENQSNGDCRFETTESYTPARFFVPSEDHCIEDDTSEVPAAEGCESNEIPIKIDTPLDSCSNITTRNSLSVHNSDHLRAPSPTCDSAQLTSNPMVSKDFPSNSHPDSVNGTRGDSEPKQIVEASNEVQNRPSQRSASAGAHHETPVKETNGSQANPAGSTKGLAKRKTYPEIKVSVIEYIVTAPDCYTEDHIHKRLNCRNTKYRRHANSISYSLESPSFILEPAEKSKIKRNLTTRSLTNLFPVCSLSNRSQDRDVKTTDSSPSNFTASHVLRSLGIFKNPAFCCIALIMTLYEFVFVTTSTVIVDFSRDVGCEETTAKWLLMIFSAGDILGRLCLGWVTDMGFLKETTFTMINFLGISLVMIGMTFVEGFGALSALILVFGIMESGVITMFPVLSKAYIAEEDLTMALSSGYFGPGIIALIIPIIIGAFRDRTGSYTGLLYLVAGTSFLGGLLSLVLPRLKYSKT